LILASCGALEIIAFDPPIGDYDVRYQRKYISFTFDRPVVTSSIGFVTLMVMKTDTKYIGFNTIPVHEGNYVTIGTVSVYVAP
jgi:hypothetical protein